MDIKAKQSKKILKYTNNRGNYTIIYPNAVDEIGWFGKESTTTLTTTQPKLTAQFTTGIRKNDLCQGQYLNGKTKV